MSEAFDSVFDVTVQPRDDRACVVLVGEWDLASSGRLEREVVALLEGGCPAIELDLRELAFIDSSGVHELLRSRSHAAERDAALSLVLVPGPVRRALEICAMLDDFDIELRDQS
jgi:anti-sigma B factor antagonist